MENERSTRRGRPLRALLTLHLQHSVLTSVEDSPILESVFRYLGGLLGSLALISDSRFVPCLGASSVLESDLISFIFIGFVTPCDLVVPVGRIKTRR